MFAFDDPELNIPDPQKSPVTMVGADDSGIGMSLPRPVLGENQEKTNGSTGSCKSTDTVVSTSSVKKQWSPNAKRPKRRVQTISGPRFEGKVEYGLGGFIIWWFGFKVSWFNELKLRNAARFAR